MKLDLGKVSKIALALFCVLLLAGCGGYEQEATSDQPAEEPVANEAADEATAELALDIPAPMQELVVAALVKADAVDGTTDHVVANCPGCALAMEGNAEHALHVADHELHFCSEDCKARFVENAVENLIAMNSVETEE